MRVSRIDEPRDYIAAAGPLLVADEARHNLLLGILATLRDHPGHYPEHRLWLVEDEGEVVAAALRTPPHGLVLARPRRAAALGALAAAIDDELPGVLGGVPEVEQFAGAYGRPWRRRFAQGIYRLEQVRDRDGSSGRPRRATAADRELVLGWWHDFVREAMHEAAAGEREERNVDQRLGGDRDAGVMLWEDGDAVVSMAGFGGPTPNGIRIGPVFTPPELRGRGYASALVAALSRELLAGGRRFCFLYTDLANPTANRIYERIGYERVCESAEIVFD